MGRMDRIKEKAAKLLLPNPDHPAHPV